MATVKDNLKTLVKVFRRECHRVLKSERTTIHGADGMLMVLQLNMAEVNKQESGEFKVALSDVLMAWKHLLLDKLHLPLENLPRPEKYDLIRAAYDSFLERSNTVDLLDVHSMYARLRLEADPEEPLSPVQLFDFLMGNGEASEPELSAEAPLVPSTPSNRSRPANCPQHLKRAVRRVFCSYLDLLVNSKNDLALACTLDVPSRELGRQAFTDVKHAARKSNNSFFLAVASFVRAIQLGGKGYAPAESDPLRKHMKGLSDFVQYLDNLEEILGEIPNPSACGSRLVSSIRAVLAKGRGSGDQVVAQADQTAKELKERISQLHQNPTWELGTGISPARFKSHAINHATAFGGRETVKVLLAVLDEEALAPPCTNKADLLSEDQPVLGEAEGTSSIFSLFRSPEVSSGTSPEPLRKRVQSRQDLLKPKASERVIRSQFACTYNDEEPPRLNRVLDFLSTSQVPTCVHPAPKRHHAAAGDDDEDCPPEHGSLENLLGTDANAEESSSSAVKAQQRGVCPAPGGATFGPRSGNAPKCSATGPGGRKKEAKGGKRKQVDVEQDGAEENHPPAKKCPPKKPTTTKGQGKKKLIAGQGTLTSFFRV